MTAHVVHTSNVACKIFTLFYGSEQNKVYVGIQFHKRHPRVLYAAICDHGTLRGIRAVDVSGGIYGTGTGN